MKARIVKFISSLGVGLSLSVSGATNAIPPRPTHADAAVILAKYSGLFDRYVDPDATMGECVSFLNETGIYFGLLEVVSGAEFTLAECARVLGQIELILLGEAEYLAGKVILPKGIDSWESYCIMNGVKYREGYGAIVQTMQLALADRD
jgi:hypothetical protein